MALALALAFREHAHESVSLEHGVVDIQVKEPRCCSFRLIDEIRDFSFRRTDGFIGDLERSALDALSFFWIYHVLQPDGAMLRNCPHDVAKVHVFEHGSPALPCLNQISGLEVGGVFRDILHLDGYRHHGILWSTSKGVYGAHDHFPTPHIPETKGIHGVPGQRDVDCGNAEQHEEKRGDEELAAAGHGAATE